MLVERLLCDFLGSVEFMPHTSTLQNCLWFIFISLRFYNSLSFICLEFCADPGVAYTGNWPGIQEKQGFFLLYDIGPF